MKKLQHIGLVFLSLLVKQFSYAQTPKFRDLPDQQYVMGTTITPLQPDMRSASGPVPPNVYGEVITIAGSGVAGMANANGRSASFKNPLDVKMDAAGNLYVADAGNHAIRKIAPDGTVTTFAGNGTDGYADGPGTAARFNSPCAMVFDVAGNLYVVDRLNQLIRKITPAGQVSVFAGVPGQFGVTNNTFNNPMGITIDKFGRIYVADTNNQRIREVPGGYIVPFAGSGGGRGPQPDFNGPGIVTKFAHPVNITTGPDDNFYVTDAELIRMINPSAISSTAAGVAQSKGPFDGDSRTAVFQDTYGIVLDKAGTMFISDAGNNLIRRFGRREDFVSKLAGGGAPGTDGVGAAAGFNQPAGMCIDANGFIYLADRGSNSIRKISTTGYKIFPELPPGLLFDARTGIISGTPTKAWPATQYNVVGYNTDGMGQYGVVIQVNEFSRQPQKLTLDPIPNKKETDADFAVTVTRTNNTLPFTLSTSDISVASIADGKVHIVGPGTVTIYADQKGNPFYSDAPQVSQTFVVAEVVPVYEYPTVKPKTSPVLLPLDGTGNLNATYNMVADITTVTGYGDPSIELKRSAYTCSDIGPQTATILAGYGPDPIDPLSAKFDHPTSIVFDKVSGKLYIPDRNYRIRTIGTNGRVGTIAGSGLNAKIDGKGKTAGFGREMPGITADAQGNVFVCDVINKAIRKITPAGIVSTFAYEALLPFNDYDPLIPRAVAADAAGNIYVADKNRVYKILPDGSSASVFAGNGKEFNTDGLGAAASFSSITGLFFAGDGNLYVCSDDLNNENTVRKITPGGLVTTVYRKTDPLLRFTNLVVDKQGNVFVASSEPKIYKITPTGAISIFAGSADRIGKVDGAGATMASFNNPMGIGIDPADNLYIADLDNHLIRKITPNGLVSTIAGSNAGYFDNTNLSNKKQTDIPVIVTSPITITSTYKPLLIPYLDACPAVLADFRPSATATSGCTTDITFSQSPAPGKVLADGEVVNVTLTAKDNLSPYDDASVTFTVTAQKLPTPTVKINESILAGCAGLDFTFTAEATNAGQQPGYRWFVNGIEKFSGGPEFTSNTLITGDRVTVTVTNNDGCAPVSSAPSAAAMVQADPSVTTSVSITSTYSGPACSGSLITFKAEPHAVQTIDGRPMYQWQINGLNAGGDSPSFTSANLKDGDEVTCVMTSGGKCVLNPVTTSAPIKISVLPEGECSVVVPNTFTPNGDGINDLWQIPVLKNYPGSTTSIYTRSGQLVYQSTGYAKAWDGQYKGSNLPAGTYYYLIDTHTFRPLGSGWVTIIR